jgi:hypothetical protein
MKTIAMLLLMTVTAAAQFSPPSKTVPWREKDGGPVKGTATFHKNHVYLRDNEGVHVMTIVVEGQNVTVLDPNGKVIPPTKK